MEVAKCRNEGSFPKVSPSMISEAISVAWVSSLASRSVLCVKEKRAIRAKAVTEKTPSATRISASVKACK
jgi:hypothetical protein